MPSALSPSCEIRSRATGFALLVATVALLAGGKAVLYGPIDPDFFLHLIAADGLTRSGIGPIVDTTSYTSNAEPWTPYSWLAELAMKQIFDRGGHRAAVATYALLSAAFVMLTAWTCRQAQRNSGVAASAGDRLAHRSPSLPAGPLPRDSDDASSASFTAAVLATTASTFLTLPYLSFRPVTMALVILTFGAALIYRDRSRGERTRAVWLVVPLTVLLVNVHLFAILIPMWLAALGAGAIVERLRADDATRPEASRRFVRLLALTGATSLACLATPMLPGAIASVVRYQFADPIVASGLIAEFQPFHASAMGKVALAIVLVMLGTLLVNRGRLRAGDWASVAFAIILLLRMGRMSPVFAIIVAPLFARGLRGMGDVVLARPAVRAGLTVLLVAGMVRVVTALPPSGMSLDDWMARSDAPYPVAAAAFVEVNVRPRSGRLINDYSWGGYLAWRLAGDFKVLLTGNTPAFPLDLWSHTYFCDDATRRRTLADAHADAAIVPTSSLFGKALLEMGWTVAYADDRSRVLIPPDGAASAE